MLGLKTTRMDTGEMVSDLSAYTRLNWLKMVKVVKISKYSNPPPPSPLIRPPYLQRSCGYIKEVGVGERENKNKVVEAAQIFVDRSLSQNGDFCTFCSINPSSVSKTFRIEDVL